MKTFFDSSAYAKRFIEEEDSQEIDQICNNTTALALSIICLPELLSALNRRKRENVLSQENYNLAKTRLLEDIGDAIVINLTQNVISRSIDLLETYILRAMDAIQIASALEWNADLLVTSDIRQAKAAEQSGLNIKYI
jgi:predicted nucleic acid-binding protein